MILTYLNTLDELNKMSCAVILRLKGASFSDTHNFSVEEILNIKKSTEKLVYLSVECLYHEDEIDYVISSIEKLKDLDGFIFQDMGLMNIFINLGIMDKAIYAPETFITSSLDTLIFEKTGLNKFLISREITLDNIRRIIELNEGKTFFYKSVSHQMMFYSYRPNLSNFNDEYNLGLDLKNRDLFIKEKTRDEYYIIKEDDMGLRIHKEIISLPYEEVKDLRVNHILDRSFINDDMYYDLIDLFSGKISYLEFNKKHDSIKFDKGYMYRETGLLKEKKDE